MLSNSQLDALSLLLSSVVGCIIAFNNEIVFSRYRCFVHHNNAIAFICRKNKPVWIFPQSNRCFRGNLGTPQDATKLSSYGLLSCVIQVKISSSTEATISTGEILLGTIANLRLCASPFFSCSVNSLKEVFNLSFFLRFGSESSDSLLLKKQDKFFVMFLYQTDFRLES